MKRRISILLIFIVFAGGFLFVSSRLSQNAVERHRLACKEWDSVPFINGEIIKAQASPGFSSVDIIVVRKEDHFAALFDLKKKSITEEHLINYDNINAIQLIQKPSNQSKSIYYKSDYDTDVEILYEYDLKNKNSKVIRRLPKCKCIGLFNIKDQPCVAVLYRATPGSSTYKWEYSWDRIDILDIYSGHKIVSISGQGWDLDWAILDMSPDGKMFYLIAGASGGACHLISQTSEAATALQNHNKAIFYYNGVDKISYIGWWKYDSKNKKQQFLVILPEGLWITSSPETLVSAPRHTTRFRDSELILKHQHK